MTSWLLARHIHEIAHAESYRRGQAYVRDGSVTKCQMEVDGKAVLVQGRVQGSSNYRVSFLFSFETHAIESFACSCPYDWGGACKHVVALALAAAERADPRVADRASVSVGDEQALIDMLAAHAAKKGVSMRAKDLADLAKKLGMLGVHPGTFASSAQAQKKLPELYHDFSRARLHVDYDAKNDDLSVRATAVYGPFDIPLFAEHPDEVIKDGICHRIERDISMEETALQNLSRAGLSMRYEPDGHRSVIHGSDIFFFIDRILPVLEANFEILVTDAAERIMTLGEASVSVDAELKEADAGWFTLHLAWNTGERELTPEEIAALAAQALVIRKADGTFAAVKNTTDHASLADWFTDQDHAQTGEPMRLPRYRAIEVVDRIEERKLGQMRTSESLTQLVSDARAGALPRASRLSKKLAGILRPYQKEAVAWAAFLRHYGFGGILADDMGLGKTLEALAVLSTDRPPDAGPSLVVCPKTLIPIWIAEAARFAPNIRTLAIEGNAAEREKLIRKGKADLFVTSYPLLRRDIKWYAERKSPFYYAILDEAQFAKNAASQTAQTIRGIPAHHRLALTGTPLENNVGEFWSVFDWLMPGFLGSKKEFRERFERPIERGDGEVMQDLRRRTRPFMLRRTKESVAPELPPRIEQTMPCDMSDIQAASYASVLARVRADVEEVVERKGFAKSRIEILAALTKLRQICNHPSLVDQTIPFSPETSGKVQLALELVREAVKGGHKVLLFSQFTRMLHLLQGALANEGIFCCLIEGKTKDRAAEIRRFCEDADLPVFLLSLRAAGVGLTLTVSDTVILFDPWWNPAVERQAMDRAHRIGQTKPVTVHKLVTKGTVEEKVLALQEKKKKIFEAVVGESTEGFTGLTWEDMRGLFDT